MPLHAGARLGPYEIVALMGRGGMGEVDRALDTRVGRTVAVKVLTADAAAHPERRQRFEREARAVARLNHPHICTLYDVGEAVISRQSPVTSHQPPATSPSASSSWSSSTARRCRPAWPAVRCRSTRR